MKKYLFLALALALVLTGCQEKVVCNFHSETIYLPAYQSDWEFDYDAQQFFCHFDVPEITRDVYDNGIWTVSCEFGRKSKNPYMVALPMSVFMTDTLSDLSVVYYTQYFDYRVGVGYVEVQATMSDYLYPTDPKGNLVPPEAMTFRLQMTY